MRTGLVVVWVCVVEWKCEVGLCKRLPAGKNSRMKILFLRFEDRWQHLSSVDNVVWISCLMERVALGDTIPVFF